jgi:hypothetical protein
VSGTAPGAEYVYEEAVLQHTPKPAFPLSRVPVRLIDHVGTLWNVKVLLALLLAQPSPGQAGTGFHCPLYLCNLGPTVPQCLWLLIVTCPTTSGIWQD